MLHVRLWGHSKLQTEGGRSVPRRAGRNRKGGSGRILSVLPDGWMDGSVRIQTGGFVCMGVSLGAAPRAYSKPCTRDPPDSATAQLIEKGKQRGGGDTERER